MMCGNDEIYDAMVKDGLAMAAELKVCIDWCMVCHDIIYRCEHEAEHKGSDWKRFVTEESCVPKSVIRGRIEKFDKIAKENEGQIGNEHFYRGLAAIAKRDEFRLLLESLDKEAK